MSFGRELRQVFAEHHVTQKAVAERIGVTPTAVYYWCSNRARPSMANVVAIEQMLGLEQGALLVRLAYEAKT